MIRLTSLGQAAIVCLLALLFILVVIGIQLDTMRFHFKGLVGALLDDAADTVEYSVLNVGSEVGAHSGEPGSSDVGWFQFCYFMFAVALPIGLCIDLMMMWILPLRLHRQRQLVLVTELLNAWACLDVFSVAMLASILEVQEFVKYEIESLCGQINNLLAAYDPSSLAGDDTCFAVEASLTSETAVLFIAAVLLTVVSHTTLYLASAAMERRWRREEEDGEEGDEEGRIEDDSIMEWEIEREGEKLVSDIAWLRAWQGVVCGTGRLLGLITVSVPISR